MSKPESAQACGECPACVQYPCAAHRMVPPWQSDHIAAARAAGIAEGRRLERERCAQVVSDFWPLTADPAHQRLVREIYNGLAAQDEPAKEPA